MKKLLIGFLAVGLIMGFAMTASAQPNIKGAVRIMLTAHMLTISLSRKILTPGRTLPSA